MALTDLLKRITTSQQSLQVDRIKAYRKLVAEIADEREPDVDTISATIEQAGKTVQDLATDVEKLLERRELSKQAKRVPECERKMLALKKKIDAVVEAFSKIEEKHDSEIEQLQHQYKSLAGASRAGQQAKAKLIQTVTDEELLEEKEATDRAFSEKHAELSEANEQLELRKRRHAEALGRSPGSEIIDGTGRAKLQHDDCEQEAAKWADRIAGSEKQIAKLHKELAKIELQREKLEEQLIDP